MLQNQVDLLKNKLLDAIASTGTLKRACEIAGVRPCTHYAWLRNDPAYKAAFDDATEEAAEMLEEEAFRRGHDGVEETIFWKGQEIAKVRKYSDSLLLSMLKARKSALYGDKLKQEISAKGGTPFHAPDLTKLNNEEIEQLELLLRKATPVDTDGQ